MENISVDISSDPSPAVGRMVWYWSYGSPNGEFKSEHRAAIITQVFPQLKEEHELGIPPKVGLAVLNPTGMYFNIVVPYSTGVPGHWSWPVY